MKYIVDNQGIVHFYRTESELAQILADLRKEEER